jgi:hypothetical protein
MDLDAIVRDIDAEIGRLEKARALLTGHTASGPAKKRKPMSAEGRARIAAGQKKRWAKAKRLSESPQASPRRASSGIYVCSV